MVPMIAKKMFAVRARPQSGQPESVRDKLAEVDAFLRGSDADVKQQGPMTLYELPNVTYLMFEDDQQPGIIFTVLGAPNINEAIVAIAALVGDGWVVEVDPRFQKVLSALPWIIKGGAMLALLAVVGIGYWIWKKRG